MYISGTILSTGPTDERRYIVALSIISWSHAQNDPCICSFFQSNHLPILFLKAKNQEQNENIPSIIIREIENFRSTYSQFLIKQLVLQLIKRYIEKHVVYTR